MEIALALSLPLNTSTMIERVAGIIIAAPAPITARAAINCPVVSAYAVASDATPNTTSPAWSIRARPKRSPRAPMISNRPPKTRM